MQGGQIENITYFTECTLYNVIYCPFLEVHSQTNIVSDYSFVSPFTTLQKIQDQAVELFFSSFIIHIKLQAKPRRSRGSNLRTKEGSRLCACVVFLVKGIASSRLGHSRICAAPSTSYQRRTDVAGSETNYKLQRLSTWQISQDFAEAAAILSLFFLQMSTAKCTRTSRSTTQKPGEFSTEGVTRQKSLLFLVGLEPAGTNT